MDDTIGEMVRQRRQALSGADDGRRPWGLALSGGGIRSATFCLGLLKALAQGRQLLRFDLVSTVSGGGYIGATLGRLCTRATSADEVRAVEGAFAEVDKMRFGWWLRSNGRYLIPGGLRDTLFAVSLYLRNLLGTHIEIAIAATLIGLGLAMVNLLLWEAVAATVDLDNAQRVATPLRWATQVPTLWLAGLVPWALSIVLANAYWSVRDRPSVRSALGQMALWCGLGALAWVVRPALEQKYGGPLWLAPAFIGFATAWVLALVWVQLRSSHRRSPPMLRNELTDLLATMVYLMLIVVLLGLLDWSAWWLAANTQKTRVSYGGLLLVAAAGLRGVLPMLFSGKSELPGIGRTLLLTLGSIVGLVVAFCLAAWWIGVLYAAVLLPVFTPAGLDFSRGWVWLGTIGVIVGSYAIFTGRNFAFLNVSSLHMFYKARIVRGYLGAANRERLGDDPIEQVSGLAPPQVPVGQVHAGDDIALRDYAPHQHGGPVHLVNVCINQTHDPKQKLFNRDRRSLPLTVAPLAWMQAVGAPWAQARGDAALTLGSWASISGAAFAPGLGRLTKRGIAALSVFAGLRLGYWWNSKEAGIAQPGAARRVSTFLMKTRFMLLECFGSFPGSGSANWYLSDGGHFENTGAYALLRQEAELIVIADCGADPEYRFYDLENLIRRARIDLNADIVFLKPCGDADVSWRADFGSLNDLASPNSQACLALARVDYASGLHGHIVLVKPNVSADLPVDLVNFKAANPLFPQQSTTDQFFDEAQWESYFQLGSEIGQRLGGEMLARAALGVDGLFEADDGQPGAAVARSSTAATAAAQGPGSGSAGAMAAVSRLQARVLKAGAVTASLGLGTAATFAVAAWQGIDSWRTLRAEQDRAENLSFKDLTERWSRLRVNAPPGEAPASLAAELLRTGDLLCREGRENFLAKFQLSVRIVDDAKIACREELNNASAPAAGGSGRLSASPACARLLDPNNGIDCLQAAAAPACAPRYWARDYSGRTPPQENCSGFEAGASSLLAAIVTRLRSPFEVRFREVGVPPPVAAPPVEPVPSESGADAAAGAAAPGAAPSPAAPPPAPSLVPSNACAGALVYIQIFGPEQRDAARALRPPWRALGASVPPIEDVLASSRAAGRAPPPGHPEPTIVYHGAAMQPCAELLAAATPPPSGTWARKPLAPGLTPKPGTLVVWLPRPRLYSQVQPGTK
jgi:hypothetical protein